MRGVIAWCVAAAIISLWARADAQDPDEVAQLVRDHGVSFGEEGITWVAASTPDDLEARLKNADRYARILPPVDPGANDGVGFGLDLYEIEGLSWAVPRTRAARRLETGFTPIRIRQINGEDVALARPEAVRETLALAAANGTGTAEIDYALADGTRASGELAAATFGADESVDRVKLADHPAVRLFDSVPGETRAAVRTYLLDLVAAGEDLAVIDLRFHEGGDVYATVEVSELFLPRDAITLVRQRPGGAPEVFRSPGDGLWSGKPVAVIIGPRTASSGELLARTLSDVGARLIGQPSFGKCAAQTVFDLSDGSALVLTTEVLLDNDLQPCEGVPLRPDTRLPLRALMSDRDLARALAPPALRPRIEDTAAPVEAPAAPIQALTADRLVCADVRFSDRDRANTLRRRLAISVDLDGFQPSVFARGPEHQVCFGPFDNRRAVAEAVRLDWTMPEFAFSVVSAAELALVD